MSKDQTRTCDSGDGPIISNPRILGGSPVISGTRVPVSALLEYLVDGRSIDYFVETFPSVSRERVVEVLQYTFRRIERDWD